MKVRIGVLVLSALLLATACGSDDGDDNGDAAASCDESTSFGEFAEDAPTPTPPFDVDTVTLTGDETKEICVQVASEGDQQEIGLMGRTSMAADVGMLFEFPAEHQGAFWMKDTLIPLSIAFADADGTILDILDMQPCEADPCDIYQASAPYMTALEVNIGAFDTWGIQEGDTLLRS
jgi:hypothetical protein